MKYNAPKSREETKEMVFGLNGKMVSRISPENDLGGLEKKRKKKKTKNNAKGIMLKMLTYEKGSPRVTFKSVATYLFAILNVSIGLGNVLIFPQLAYQYRGGSFVFVYFICLLIFGIPVLYLELVIGQYHRCSPLVFFRRCAPILQGFGWLTVFDTIFMIFPYQQKISHMMKFLVSLIMNPEKTSFETCDNDWNDKETCYLFFEKGCVNSSGASFNSFKGHCFDVKFVENNQLQQAEVQYITHVLRDKTNVEYGLFYTSMIFWATISFIHNQGILTVVKFAIIPNMMVFIFYPFVAIRAISLEGSLDGIYEMFAIDWDLVVSPDIWISAFQQVMFSLSLGFGAPMTIASFAPPYTNTYKIALGAVAGDTLFSLLNCGVIFATLGYMKEISNAESIYKLMPSNDQDIVHVLLSVLVRSISHNHYTWMFFFYIVTVLMSWGTILLFVLPITVTIGDSWNLSTKLYSYDLISVVCCIFLGLTSFFLSFSASVSVVDVMTNAQKALQGLQLVAELLIVVEVYGVNNIYGDILVLTGPPMISFLNNLGRWSPFWKLTWCIGPVFALINITTAFKLNTILSSDDSDHFLLQLKQLMFEVILITTCVLVVPAFMFYSHLKMKEHFANHEKKEYNWKVILMKQKHFRSWMRIARQMKIESRENFKQYEKLLPEIEPEDLERHWKLIYRQFFQVVMNKLNKAKKRRIGIRKNMDKKVLDMMAAEPNISDEHVKTGKALEKSAEEMMSHEGVKHGKTKTLESVDRSEENPFDVLNPKTDSSDGYRFQKIERAPDLSDIKSNESNLNFPKSNERILKSKEMAYKSNKKGKTIEAIPVFKSKERLAGSKEGMGKSKKKTRTYEEKTKTYGGSKEGGRTRKEKSNRRATESDTSKNTVTGKNQTEKSFRVDRTQEEF